MRASCIYCYLYMREKYTFFSVSFHLNRLPVFIHPANLLHFPVDNAIVTFSKKILKIRGRLHMICFFPFNSFLLLLLYSSSALFYRSRFLSLCRSAASATLPFSHSIPHNTIFFFLFHRVVIRYEFYVADLDV